jgi:hypothetical protein
MHDPAWQRRGAAKNNAAAPAGVSEPCKKFTIALVSSGPNYEWAVICSLSTSALSERLLKKRGRSERSAKLRKCYGRATTARCDRIAGGECGGTSGV